MLTFWCFTIAAAATLLTGHSLLAGLVAGLVATGARYALPRVLPRAVAFGNTHRTHRAQRRSGGSGPSPTGRPMASARKWRSIPMPGRIIIVAVAVLVFAVAGVACATSYNAIYRLVGMLGLYGKDITKVFPLMLEVAFIGCELAAILGAILRALHVARLRFPAGMDPDDEADALREARRQVSRGWPAWTMLTCGVATMAFNVAHAWLLSGPAQSPAPGLQVVSGTGLVVWRCVVAAFPPLVMMLFFQVLIAIVKWTMVTIGRPLHTGAALAPTTMAQGYGAFPPAVPGYSPALDGTPEVYGQVPSWASSETPQTGHVLEPGAKRRAVEAYLSNQTSQDLLRLNGERVAQDVHEEHGIQVSKRYAESLLEEARSRADQAAMGGNSARGRKH